MTWRIVKKIDYAAMNMNGITSSDTHESKVSMAFETDREAILLRRPPPPRRCIST
jgi:hypothetical protein